MSIKCEIRLIIRDVKTWEKAFPAEMMIWYNEYYEAMLQVYVLPWKTSKMCLSVRILIT